MINLYDENNGFVYTDLGSTLDKEVYTALLPIFDKYIEYECSPRDIVHIMQGAAMELELFHVAFHVAFRSEGKEYRRINKKCSSCNKESCLDGTENYCPYCGEKY